MSFVLKSEVINQKICKKMNLLWVLGMNRFVVVVALLFNIHGKHLRSYRDGQLT